MSSSNVTGALYKGKYAHRELSRSEEDLRTYQELFCKNLGPRDFSILQWRYGGLWREGTQVLIAEDISGPIATPAAIYSLHGCDLMINGAPIPAAQSIDTVTDIEHRGQGLFKWLARSAYELFAERGGQVVFGFPNPNSHATFAGQLQWSMLNPMPFIMRPLRTGYFATILARKLGVSALAGKYLDWGLYMARPKTMPGLQILEMHDFDTRHDQLWLKFSRDIGVCVNRSASFMTWRILRHPHQKYSVYGAFHGEELLAEIAWCVENKHGGRIGYIVELICDPQNDAAGRSLLHHTLAAMQQRHCDAVLAWNVPTSPNARAYRSAGFFPLPTAMRPTDIYWGFRNFGSFPREVLLRREGWYISYVDSDTV